MPPLPFGVLFLRKSFVLGGEAFDAAGPGRWTLDLRKFLPDAAALDAVKEVCLFLQPHAPSQGLGPEHALSLYVKAGSSAWSYRGSVTLASPSNAFPVQWPRDVGGMLGADAQIGVCLESAAEVAQREVEELGSKGEFAKRVAMDLFRFMESFAGGTPGPGSLVVPSDCIDRWYEKFTRKLRLDPDFLTRKASEI